MSSEKITESKVVEGEGLSEEQKTLLNRQIYAFGYEAQSKISKANVLLIGLKGLGVEIGIYIIYSMYTILFKVYFYSYHVFLFIYIN